MGETTTFQELKRLIESEQFHKLSVVQSQQAFFEGVQQAELSLSASNGKCLVSASDLDCFRKFVQNLAGQEPQQATQSIVRLLGFLHKFYKSKSGLAPTQNAKSLQTTIFSLLSTPPGAADDCLTVLAHIWPLTEHMSIADAVDIWKKFVFLTSKYKPIVVANQLSKQRWSTFNFPLMVEFLNKQIINNIRTASATSRTTKISGVYVTILDKFRPICPKDCYPAQKDLCETVLTILSLKYSSKDTTIISDIEQILPLYLNLVQKTYSEADFVQHMLSKKLDNTPDRFAFSELSMQIIKWALVDKAAFEQYTDLFAKLMLMIPEFHPIFYTQDGFYKRLVEHLSALMFISLLRGRKNVEDIMVTSVLQDNFWLGMVACDLWALLAKSITEHQCLEYFKFWTAMHQELFAADQLSLFVNVVLQHLFAMLSVETDAIEDILTQKPVTDYPALWTVLRLDENADLHAGEVNKTVALMEEFLNRPNETSSKMLRVHLALVATRPFEPHEKFKSKLIDLWEMALKNSPQRNLPLVNAVADVILATQKCLSNEEIYKFVANSVYLCTSTLSLKITCLRLIGQMTMKGFKEDTYLPKVTTSMAKILVRLLDESDDLLRASTLEVLNGIQSENYGRKVLATIFQLKPTVKSVLASYSKQPTSEMTLDQATAYLEEHRKLENLTILESKETYPDFDDDQLIAGFADDMLCSSTQKRASPEIIEVTLAKKVKLKEDHDVADEIEKLLEISQRIRTKRRDADTPLSAEHFDKIYQVVTILKSLK